MNKMNKMNKCIAILAILGAIFAVSCDSNTGFEPEAENVSQAQLDAAVKILETKIGATEYIRVSRGYTRNNFTVDTSVEAYWNASFYVGYMKSDMSEFIQATIYISNSNDGSSSTTINYEQIIFETSTVTATSVELKDGTKTTVAELASDSWLLRDTPSVVTKMKYEDEQWDEGNSSIGNASIVFGKCVSAGAYSYKYTFIKKDENTSYKFMQGSEVLTDGTYIQIYSEVQFDIVS